MNVADSEVVASVMGMAGYEVTEDMEQRAAETRRRAAAYHRSHRMYG